MYRTNIRRLVAIILLCVCASACELGQAPPKGELGQVPNQKPSILDQVGIDQPLSQQAPLDLTFMDESGQPVQLLQYFGQKPVIIALVYYQCTMLCSEVLNGLTGTLNGSVRFNVGRHFNILTVSFEPRDT